MTKGIRERLEMKDAIKRNTCMYETKKVKATLTMDLQ